MNQSPDYKLLFCLITVAIVWGTTFFGIRIAVETIPPWFVTSIRQGIAALIVFMILLYKKEFAWIGWENFKRQLIPSILMIVIANGFTTIAEQTLPSGLASILSALSPLVIFIGSIIFGLQQPSLKGFVGVIIGFLGVVFIFREGLGDILDPNYMRGIFFIGMAILGWALGTIYSKKQVHKTTSIALNLFYQFTISTVIQLVLAFIFSENINLSLWSTASILAVIYLAVFGSVIAFFCYYYALKRVSAVQVSILSYFNTIIAVFLGWLLLDEVVTFDFIIATGLIITGVFITNYKKKVKVD
ncbi:MAG: EamA family transporter [Flavobacterium sp.]